MMHKSINYFFVNMGKKHFDIIFVADNTYAPYTAVTLQSLFDFHPQWEFDIWLLSCDFSLENVSIYNNFYRAHNANFHLLNINPNELNIYENIGFWSKYTFLKLLIVDKLPSFVHYALHLDGDLLITNNLEELFSTALKDDSLAAVEDLTFVKDKKHKTIWHKSYRYKH